MADGSLLDYETATSHNLTVKVTDGGSNTYTETFTVNLADAQEAPTDLSFSGESFGGSAGAQHGRVE